MSVYFRLLNSGRWIGVNEEEKYTPASLLKVVLMSAYFKASENNPGLLGGKVLYTKDAENLDKSNPKPLVRLEIGRWYSIDSVIEQMIRHSDNAASFILLDHLPPKVFDDAFRDLDLPVPTTKDESGLGYMSAKSYGLIWRVLYGASYLSRSLSEKALEILAQTDFDGGLRAGVPVNLVVAHKFGSYTSPAGMNEMHDCGIIYYPQHPYLLCVMTRGSKSFGELADVIKNISMLVYEGVDSFF
jgi:beta-lactamase class A